MASRHVVVRVLDGVSVVDPSIRRPVRLTPLGYAGVVYAGAVYPLRSDDSIDVSGASWEIEDSNRFLLSGAEIPYAPGPAEPTAESQWRGFSGEWTVETNKFGHYVVFNAAERVASQVVDALEEAGLSVQRWDVSHRPAADGKFYDWFARLRFQGSHDECMALVSAVFSPTLIEPPVVIAPPQPATKRLEDLQAQVEQLAGQVAALSDKLAASARTVAGLESTITAQAAHEAQLTADLKRAHAHQRSLHEELAALSSAATEAPDLAKLMAVQSETEELLELALAENAELQHQLSVLHLNVDQGNARVLTLEAMLSDAQEQLEEIGEREREHRQSQQTRVAPRRGLAGFLDSAFPRLEFVFDSIEILQSFESPAAALRALVEIDTGSNVGKDLEGIRGWREVSKVATGIAGSEDLGRIYYNPSGDRVLVSVHIKQDDKVQKRHIERLRSILKAL